MRMPSAGAKSLVICGDGIVRPIKARPCKLSNVYIPMCLPYNLRGADDLHV